MEEPKKIGLKRNGYYEHNTAKDTLRSRLQIYPTQPIASGILQPLPTTRAFAALRLLGEEVVGSVPLAIADGL